MARTPQSVPFGQMSQAQFNALVMQEMQNVGNGDVDAQQIARDNVAMRLNKQEGRGGTAYRPSPDQVAQSAQSGPASSVRGASSAQMPTPTPRPSNVDASIDATMEDATTLPAMTVNSSPVNEQMEDQRLMRQAANAGYENVAAQDRLRPDGPNDMVDNVMQQTEAAPESASSLALMLTGGAVGTAGAAYAAQKVAQLIRENDPGMLNLITSNGVDPEAMLYELEVLGERGAASDADLVDRGRIDERLKIESSTPSYRDMLKRNNTFAIPGSVPVPEDETLVPRATPPGSMPRVKVK